MSGEETDAGHKSWENRTSLAKSPLIRPPHLDFVERDFSLSSPIYLRAGPSPRSVLLPGAPFAASSPDPNKLPGAGKGGLGWAKSGAEQSRTDLVNPRATRPGRRSKLEAGRRGEAGPGARRQVQGAGRGRGVWVFRTDCGNIAPFEQPALRDRAVRKLRSGGSGGSSVKVSRRLAREGERKAASIPETPNTTHQMTHQMSHSYCVLHCIHPPITPLLIHLVLLRRPIHIHLRRRGRKRRLLARPTRVVRTSCKRRELVLARLLDDDRGLVGDGDAVDGAAAKAGGGAALERLEAGRVSS